VLRHAVLPGGTLLITSIGGWILTMRNNVITTLAEDYVRMDGQGSVEPAHHVPVRGAQCLLPNLAGFAMSLAS